MPVFSNLAGQRQGGGGVDTAIYGVLIVLGNYFIKKEKTKVW